MISSDVSACSSCYARISEFVHLVSWWSPLGFREEGGTRSYRRVFTTTTAIIYHVYVYYYSIYCCSVQVYKCARLFVWRFWQITQQSSSSSSSSPLLSSVIRKMYITYYINALPHYHTALSLHSPTNKNSPSGSKIPVRH